MHRLIEMSELLPCPFCGGKAKLIKTFQEDDAVYCPFCDFTIDGVKAWNRRDPLKSLEAAQGREQGHGSTEVGESRSKPTPSAPAAAPDGGATQSQTARWAVFCALCGDKWTVNYQHPGKSVCDSCEKIHKDLRAKLKQAQDDYQIAQHAREYLRAKLEAAEKELHELATDAPWGGDKESCERYFRERILEIIAARRGEEGGR